MRQDTGKKMLSAVLSTIAHISLAVVISKY